MGTNRSAVDHLEGIRRCSALVQGVHDVLQETYERPALELPVDAQPYTELLRQVAPRSARADNLETPIKYKAVVGRFAPVPRGTVT